MPSRGKKRARIEHVDTQPSKVAAILVTMVVAGCMSPQLVQRLSSAAVHDIELAKNGIDVLKELRKLEDIGTKGRHSNTCRRDLYSLLCRPLLELTTIMMPFKSSDAADGWQFFPQSFVLPHITFSCLFHKYPEYFFSQMLPSIEYLKSFWAAVDGHPQLIGNPVLALLDYASTVIPCWIHGDGVVCTGLGKSWARMADAYSFGSILSKGGSMDRSFLGWMGYRYAFVCSDGPAHTMNAFWRLWRWSWDALMNGMFPASDYNNKPYAPLSPDGIRANTPLMPLGGGKYLRGMLFSSRADMDHNANTMHLSHHGSASPCTKCPSTTSTVNVPYNDFNYGRAQWVGQTFTPHTWRMTRPNQGCELFRLPFMNCHSVCSDLQHSKHSGVDKSLWGSVLFMLVFTILDGSPDDNVRYIFWMIQAEYSNRSYQAKRKTVYTYLKLGMICSVRSPHSSYPELKGRSPQAKHVGPILLEIWKKKMDVGNQVHTHVYNFVFVYQCH